MSSTDSDHARQDTAQDTGHDADELSRLGEFGLIARLTSGLETRDDVVLAAGDDAALLDTGADALLVATCDAQVEGKHFIRGLATDEEIGHKALAVNLSDIAAMGAEPRWALVSLLIPDGLMLDALEHVYAGMRALARQYDVALVGGNIAATTGPFCIDITLLGMVARERALRRDGARVNDAILVTGTLGAAAAGVLWSMTHASFVDDASSAPFSLEIRERIRRAMVAPRPQVAVGQALAANGAVTAMLDISDGLAADLWHICEASQVGVVLEAAALPVDPAAAEVATACGRDPLSLALYGGEDYELLCTVAQADVAKALAAIAGAGGTGHVIGRVVNKADGMRLHFSDGRLETLEPRGWDHLR